MRVVLRTLTAWVVTASLAAGLLLPLFAKPVIADPDEACGPVIVLAHSVQHFESATPAPTDHCVLCHLWHAMTGASTSDRADVAPPAPTSGASAALAPSHTYGSDVSVSSPRGPPAIS